MEKPLNSMLEVSGTMLITLYARACKSKSSNPVISDPKAVEVIELRKRFMQENSNARWA